MTEGAATKDVCQTENDENFAKKLSPVGVKECAAGSWVDD